MDQIMEMIECARKGGIMNIKENYYIYQFMQLNELREEQKSSKENDNQNSMFVSSIRHEYTPTGASQGTRQHSASEHSKKEATRHHNGAGRRSQDTFQINSGYIYIYI
jgi:hypothetical protein